MSESHPGYPHPHNIRSLFFLFPNKLSSLFLLFQLTKRRMNVTTPLFVSVRSYLSSIFRGLLLDSRMLSLWATVAPQREVLLLLCEACAAMEGRGLANGVKQARGRKGGRMFCPLTLIGAGNWTLVSPVAIDWESSFS